MLCRSICVSSVLALGIVLALAGPSASTAFAQPVKAEKIAGLPDNAVLAVIPADAKEIAAGLKTAKQGDPIILHGRVPMSKDAFGKNLAVFTLVDEAAMKDAQPKDSKELPNDSADIAADRKCLVRFVDKSGQPLAVDLSGKVGLKPGAEVFVVGKVHAANGSETPVVDATSLHVPKSSLPLGLFLEKAPEAVRDLSAAKKTGGFKVGDRVVLRGRVGGSVEPFVAGRAMFTLMGSGLKACSENPGDNCKEPWDYCCETTKDILAHSATIRVVDDKGQTMKTDFKGRRGLKELTTVVVVGKVAVAEGQSLVVNASGMFVEVK